VNEKDLLSVFTKLKAVEVPCVQIGLTGGDDIVVAGEGRVPADALRDAFERWLPDYMSGKAP
jgi:phosphoribosylformylglycinamidine synthase